MTCIDKLFEKWQLHTKKGIENLVILLVLLVIVMIVMNDIFSKKETKQENTQGAYPVESTKEETFEKKLESILSSISGIGSVSVMISYENSIEKIPLYDTKETTTMTEEADSSGGARTTKQTNYESTIAYEENGSQKTALLSQNVMPKMVGVIVCAQGAENPVAKEKIINAVATITGLGTNKIQVFSK